MPVLNTLRRGKLPNPSSAGIRSVKALLDAITFVLDEWECKIDFSDNASHVKAFYICQMLAWELVIQ
jgi:hypothetical protein